MKKNSFIIFLAVSFLLHLTFWGGVSLFPKSSPPETPITIDLVSTPSEINKESLDTNLKQIVDQDDKALNSEEDKNTKYLSKHTQSVKKETIARNKGEFKNSSQQSTKATVKNIANHDLKKTKPKSKTSFDPLSESAKIFKDKVYETISGATPSNSSAAGTPSQTQDYLKNTELGVETVLNTKEFKYYTYFNRIRRQLSQHWEPKVRDKLTKLFRQGRSIASEQDRVTKLLIVLNPLGVLVKVQVLGDSGVKDLDDAAIEAFKSAAPFPNPPTGIIDPDGTVKIRWDFVLES
ncbi:MAG: TonB family protein [Bdellovibrionales bacterium]|nr:TonB family protein [Bdellovibrionales bacterium]